MPPPVGLALRAVVFDVGEVLIDETTEYGIWADWLGVPRHTFSAVFGAVIARGDDHWQVFQHFRPGFDLALERLRREQAGRPELLTASDLYPDVLPCLRALKGQGLLVGLAGNQTARAERLLRQLDLPVDFVATSDGWGVEKPSPTFFEKVIGECGYEPHEIAYVGDRLDNDIRPAHMAGLVAVLLRRGPWGYIQADHSDTTRADIHVDTLEQLLQALNDFDARRNG